jgi:hypothetical protein
MTADAAHLTARHREASGGHGSCRVRLKAGGIGFADLGPDGEGDLGLGVLAPPADVVGDRSVLGVVVGVVAAVEVGALDTDAPL